MRNYVFKKRWKQLSVGCIDVMGWILWSVIKPFRAKSSPRKILVVRLDQIGDVVQAIPFFTALRKRYPTAEIHALCVKGTSFLLRHNPNIDKLHSIDTSWFYGEKDFTAAEMRRLCAMLRGERYDLAFDLRGDFRIIALLFASAVKWIVGYGCTGGGFMLDEEGRYDREEHEIDKNLNLLGERSLPELQMEFSVPREDHEAVAPIRTAAKKIITMHPFSRDTARMWGIEKFNALAALILGADPDVAIAVIGGREDRERGTGFAWGPRLIDCIGATTIYSTIDLIKHSTAFIGNNSGMQYFAAYSGIRTCVVYGSSTPYHRWIPKVKKDHFLFFAPDVECGPCELKTCPAERGHRCMEQIAAEPVFHAIKHWLSAESR